MHSEDKLFSCYTCSCQFDNTTELRLHVSKHDILKAFKCGLCDLSFLDQTSLSEHLQESHHDLPLLYKCSLCDLPFKDVSALSQHIRETHSTASAKYECGVCGKTFTQAARLKAHTPCDTQQSTRRTRSSAAVIQNNAGRIPDIDDEEKIVSAKSKSGKKKEQIRQVKKKKVPKWLSLRKTETQKKGSLFVKKQKLKAKAVTICRKYEENQGPKISHTGKSDSLSGYYSVDCGNCKKCFYSESQLKKHVENSDCGGFKCSLCSKKYHVEVSLLKHMVKHMIDSGTVELKCLQCSKTFDAEQKLIRHSVVHSQSSPFSCKLCGNRFSLSENLFKHLKRMHGHVVSDQSRSLAPVLALPDNSSSVSINSDLKKSDVDQDDSVNSSDSEVEDRESRDGSSNMLSAEHKLGMNNSDESTQNLYSVDCAKCLTSFESLDLLYKHSKESDCEGFQCSSCPQSFELETSYLRHRAKHKVDIGNKNLKCENCLRQFKSVHQFIKHSEIHAVSTPFMCRLCRCRFSSSDNLFNHLKSDHGHKFRINFAETKSDLLCTSEEHEDKDPQIVRTDLEDSGRELSELEHLDEIQFFSNDRRCQDCGKLFETARGLACHRNWNSIEGIYSVDCDECHASFESLNLLSYHLRTSSCQGYQCMLCPQVFELESSFLRHVAKHQTDNALLTLGEGAEDFKCEHCSKTFSSAPQYLRHSRNHAKSTPFRCKICSNRFTHIELLHKHAKGKHKVKISSCPDIGTLLPPENGTVLQESTGLNPVLCCRCQRTFDSVDAVVEHVKISPGHGFVCDSCGQTFATQEDLVCHEVKEHIIITANGNLQCFKCSEVLESVTDYMLHAEIHFDFLAFQCTLCGLKFISADCLKDHLTESHSEVESTSSRRPIANFKHKRRIGGACKICKKVFHSIISLKAHEANHRRIRCIPCGKIFTQRSELLQHRRNVHNHSEPVIFRCTVCDKTLSSINNLRRHERLHTGEKPFQCQFCAKMFACSDSIRSHLRTHSSEKPFKCTICNYSCKFKSGLNRHVMTHNANLERNHVCPTCGKSFRTRHNMMQHCKLHGKKSYQCSVCGAAFARKDYLDIHSRVHTMDKPYSCPVCCQSFAVASNMNSHVRRIHPDYFLQSRMKASQKMEGSDSSAQQDLDVTKALVEEPDEIHGLLNSVQNTFSYHQMETFMLKMPKTCKVLYRKYSPEDLKKAIQMVADGVTCGAAAQTFGVHRKTLADYLSGKSKLGNNTEEKHSKRN